MKIMAKLWTSDVYDLVGTVKDLEDRYIDTEDSDTLAVGIYGYLASIGATLLQNSAITTGELGNELFPARAKFERNVINHAIIQNIQTINAVPATIKGIFGIYEEDLEKYMTNEHMKEYYTIAEETSRVVPTLVKRDEKANDFYVEVKDVQPSLGAIVQGIISQSLTDYSSALKTLADDTTTEWKRASEAVGMDYSSLEFPNWDVTKDYTDADYAALK